MAGRINYRSDSRRCALFSGAFNEEISRRHLAMIPVAYLRRDYDEQHLDACGNEYLSHLSMSRSSFSSYFDRLKAPLLMYSTAIMNFDVAEAHCDSGLSLL